MDKTLKTAKRSTMDCRGIILHFKRVPLIMGILNVTPDSFSDGGKFFVKERAVEHAHRLVEEGADILDIGGESTRPGAKPVSPEEELSRIQPVLEAIIESIPIPISIDTRRASVAEAALRMGCHLVNDISGCEDGHMPEVLCSYNVPVVIMHMKGNPRTMQENPCYEDVVKEVGEYLAERANRLAAVGVAEDKIIIDPGIGFGKRFRDNLDLINKIDDLRSLGYPVLVGASRKRFLGELLDADTDGRQMGDLAVTAKCYSKNIEIVRVHDVKQTAEFLRVFDALTHPGEYSADW